MKKILFALMSAIYLTLVSCDTEETKQINTVDISVFSKNDAHSIKQKQLLQSLPELNMSVQDSLNIIRNYSEPVHPATGKMHIYSTWNTHYYTLSGVGYGLHSGILYNDSNGCYYQAAWTSTAVNSLYSYTHDGVCHTWMWAIWSDLVIK